VIRREVAERQHVLFGLLHQGCSGWDFFGEHRDHLIPLLLHCLGLGLYDHRSQGGGHHVLAAFRHLGQEVAGKVHAAALPAAALAATGDRLLETGVGVADHQLHACEAAFPQAPQESGPERLVLDVAHLDPQHLALARSGDADRHDRGFGDLLLAGRITAVEVHRNEVDVGGAAELQRPVQQGLHLSVQSLADPADFGFGDAALAAQRHHQLVHLAGGVARDVDLHHHRPQGPVHPPAWLQQRGEKAAGT